ncbi:MAG: site-specific DNA-methyltransferase [Bacteroidaceae bacterium]|nr:site-specific DNA-methyltransferase [Bacteroidaceae bacterium]
MIRDIVNDNEIVVPASRELSGLRELFPQCFDTSGHFDIDKMREALTDKVDVVREGRSYDFLGKSYARMLASMDTTTVIRPDTEHNALPENAESENIYISGDNLDALHHLVKSYAGEVKCIYIDPPYNTGSDGFVYNDRFRFTADSLQAKLSVSAEEAEKIVAMTSGHRSSHAAWQTFMLPRLLLARDLLSKDGVIFISIDDNEQAYLKQLCDNVFGEDNFVAQLTIIVKPEGRRYGDFAKTHEYALVYAKSIDNAIFNEIEVEGSTYQYQDEIGGFNLKGLRNRNVIAFNSSNRPNLRYPFYVDISNPDDNGLCKVSTEPIDGYEKVMPSTIDGLKSVWRWGKEKATNEIDKLVAYRGNDGEIRVFQKERKLTQTPKTVWFDKDIISNKGTSEVEALLGKGVFNFPKPISLIKNILSIGSDSEDIVMDFFSGSATTAEAVMRLNTETGLHRKFILVQLQEPISEDKEAYKAGYRTIDEIGMERIRRAAAKIREANPLFAGDLGFKHYVLEDVPENTLDQLLEFDPNVLLTTDETLSLFGRDTVLTTWMVRDGYGFSAPTQELNLAGYKATLCGRHLYLIDPDFTEDSMVALTDLYQSDASFNPDSIVVFGYSFGHNALELLKKNRPVIDVVKDKKPVIDVRY